MTLFSKLNVSGAYNIRCPFNGRACRQKGGLHLLSILSLDEPYEVQAYLLGQNDDHYRDMIKAAHAILFLSTPHRGTNLAEILNKILAVSILNHSPKQYISELKRNSPTLEDLNEQFRHVAPKLKIMSFFETLYTSIGPRNIVG